MKIVLNHNVETIEKESISISELMIYKNFTFKMLVVKVNGEFVPKDKYSTTIVHDNDDVIILHLISGG